MTRKTAETIYFVIICSFLAVLGILVVTGESISCSPSLHGCSGKGVGLSEQIFFDDLEEGSDNWKLGDAWFLSEFKGDTVLRGVSQAQMALIDIS